MDSLSSGCLDQTGKDAVSFKSAFRPGSEAYFPEDHHMSYRLFSLVVRRRHTRAAKESKEICLLRCTGKEIMKWQKVIENVKLYYIVTTQGMDN